MDCQAVTRGHIPPQETPISLWRNIPTRYMCFTISASYRKEVERHLKTAQRLGHVRQVKYLLAILVVVDGQDFAQVALVYVCTRRPSLHGSVCFAAMGSRARHITSPPAARPN